MEPPVHSVPCVNGIFLKPDALESLVHGAAVSSVFFPAGRKSRLVIAIGFVESAIF